MIRHVVNKTLQTITPTNCSSSSYTDSPSTLASNTNNSCDRTLRDNVFFLHFFCGGISFTPLPACTTSSYARPSGSNVVAPSIPCLVRRTCQLLASFLHVPTNFCFILCPCLSPQLFLLVIRRVWRLVVLPQRIPVVGWLYSCGVPGRLQRMVLL